MNKFHKNNEQFINSMNIFIVNSMNTFIEIHEDFIENFYEVFIKTMNDLLGGKRMNSSFETSLFFYELDLESIQGGAKKRPPFVLFITFYSIIQYSQNFQEM